MIEPVRCTIETRAPPPRAFELFTARMGDWWGSKTPAPKPAVAIVVEPHAGGRWFERAADGEETLWGKILAWEPPARLVLGWQLDRNFTYDPALVTEVEITFTPTAAGGTRVHLEHRDLARFGDAAAHMAERVGQGWPRVLSQFERFLNETKAEIAA